MLWLLDALERDPRADAAIDKLTQGRARALPAGPGPRRVARRVARPSRAPLSWSRCRSAAGCPPPCSTCGAGRTRRGRPPGPGVGLAAAGPAALAGAADWAVSCTGGGARVGLVHAVANTAAVGPYGASLLCRLTGRATAGPRLRLPRADGGRPGRHAGRPPRLPAGFQEPATPKRYRTSSARGWHRVGTVDEAPRRPARAARCRGRRCRSWWCARPAAPSTCTGRPVQSSGGPAVRGHGRRQVCRDVPGTAKRLPGPRTAGTSGAPPLRLSLPSTPVPPRDAWRLGQRGEGEMAGPTIERPGRRSGQERTRSWHGIWTAVPRAA